MRRGACAVAALLAALSAGGGIAFPEAPACTSADFEAVVNAAGAALRDLNQLNTPLFQGKLRQLKEKRSWSNDQFLKEAEPLVRDEVITAHDKKSEELVARITGDGQAGPATPDCALRSEEQCRE